MTVAPDREARFRQLVDQDVYTAVWRYCFRLTGNREDAEDLGQEVLARAFERLDQLRDDSLVKGWLFSIIRTQHIEACRRRRVRTHPGWPAELPAPDGSRDMQVVRDAVRALPGAQRDAIELFHFTGLSLAETATALGLGVNTVKQRLYRARETLKRRLASSFAAGDLEALL